MRVENSAALCWHLKNQAVGPIRDFEIVASVPGTTILPDLGLALVIEPCQTPHTDGFPRAQELHALVDLTRCSRPLVVRQRRPGDIITPFGMSGTVKLKKFLHTRKCNSELSDDVLLANAEEVLWVPGVGLSERLRVVDRATHRLSLIEMGASAEFR